MFFIVCDIGYRFDLYACFDALGNWQPLPNAQTQRIFLRATAALPVPRDPLTTVGHKLLSGPEVHHGRPRKAAFDRYVAERGKSSPTFARERRIARAEIDRTDSILRKLDASRTKAKMTKAELARRAGMPAETVRRLLTAQGVNPELGTVSRLAAELGLALQLKPA